MLSAVKDDLARALAQAVREKFGVEHEPVLGVPPRRELGDLASPAALQLAKELQREPRQIATDLHDTLILPAPVERLEIQGAGYLNFFLERRRLAKQMLGESSAPVGSGRKVVVEHTNINPNKAAHIGHLRNAVLGDVLARTLRATGEQVEVQNYIDDTGVQLADVVVGFIDLRSMNVAAVAALPEPFDYYCWDLYAEVGRWFEEDAERLELRRQTLQALETDEGERATMGRLVATRIVGRHLATMGRLGVSYDLLTHESQILQRDFFADAFEKLKTSAAIVLEDGGRNEGCWVMQLAGSAEFEGLEDPDKVIVRSDGTVTYVGKDIAYQLWKFGLLERDFTYVYWPDQGVWQTAKGKGEEDTPQPPVFGHAARVINVIDARQSYLQKIVRAGLERLGFVEEAQNSIHFAYEMVALSAAASRQLGLAEDDGNDDKTTLMSGRKGIGVKADDLLDQLQSKARDGIAERNRELVDEDLDRLSQQIAVAALRFMMVKATTSRVIAFDFEEALNFEGETGPYLQYSAVRERNIQRRLAEAGLATAIVPQDLDSLPSELWEDDLWDLVLTVAQIPEIIDRAAQTLELSLVARHAIDLARKFHSIYHRHPILREERQDLRSIRLATVEIFRRGLEELVEILGIPIPDRM